MNPKQLTYFVSDVHLGLQVSDPAGREARFVEFLRNLPRETDALYLLGDVWDFWYEYRDVVPREGARVVAELVALMDAGVTVYFFPGKKRGTLRQYFSYSGYFPPLISSAREELPWKRTIRSRAPMTLQLTIPIPAPMENT
jgi:UDP-2,3-diacylglucosamine hydrolase